jgi:cytidylate kinase
MLNMSPKITIAIDGFAACGKSTLAKALAKKLGYIYVDSGAMYRATTLYFLDNGVDYDDRAAVKTALANIDIEFRYENEQNTTYLNGKNVEAEIRQMRVSNQVSQVSTISAVRRDMVARQQAFGQQGGLAMDGRDIGTVVFPQAELKLFMTASIAVRTQRRIEELAKNNVQLPAETVQHNLTERDRIDSNREDSPLTQAADAVIIDNSNLTPEEQFNLVLTLAVIRIEGKKKRKFEMA